MAGLDEVPEARLAKAGTNVVERLLSPAADEVGTTLALAVSTLFAGWNERLRQSRERKIREVVEASARLLTARGEPTEKLESVTPDFLESVMLNASTSLGGEEVRAFFAGLLATGALSDDATKIHPAIPELLRQLAPFDARLLALTWKHGPLQTNGGRSGLLSVRPDGRRMDRYSRPAFSSKLILERKDRRELEHSRGNLERLGLAREVSWMGQQRTARPDGTPGPVGTKKEMHEFELTSLGESLCATCLGAKADTLNPTDSAESVRE
jgi:hypothetical protein